MVEAAAFTMRLEFCEGSGVTGGEKGGGEIEASVDAVTRLRAPRDERYRHIIRHKSLSRQE